MNTDDKLRKKIGAFRSAYDSLHLEFGNVIHTLRTWIFHVDNCKECVVCEKHMEERSLKL